MDIELRNVLLRPVRAVAVATAGVASAVDGGRIVRAHVGGVFCASCKSGGNRVHESAVSGVRIRNDNRSAVAVAPSDGELERSMATRTGRRVVLHLPFTPVY